MRASVQFSPITVTMHEDGDFAVTLEALQGADYLPDTLVTFLMRKDSELAKKMSLAFDAKDANGLAQALRERALGRPMQRFLSTNMRIISRKRNPQNCTFTVVIAPVA